MISEDFKTDGQTKKAILKGDSLPDFHYKWANNVVYS